ncbi:MAG TPA: TSUP family transporter [Candidatus Competibacteraceae bacterium]|nr:TSUP family transporter [Candidatus Competibacteraceae bacterium]
MAGLDLGTLLALGGVSLLAGFVDAVAGGGGMLVMPALLSIGMPPHLVLGTNKLISTFGTLTASLTFIRKGLFQPRRWAITAVATFLGALAGAVLIYQFDAGVLKKLLPLVIVTVAVYSVWPRRRGRPSITDNDHRPNAAAQTVAGTGIGFYDGFIGPGTGAFWTVAALRGFRQDLVRAAGVARFMNLMSNLAALLAFATLGAVDWLTGATMGLALMGGAWIGAHSAIRFGANLIRPVFITVVLAMAGRLLYLEFVG